MVEVSRYMNELYLETLNSNCLVNTTFSLGILINESKLAVNYPFGETTSVFLVDIVLKMGNLQI